MSRILTGAGAAHRLLVGGARHFGTSASASELARREQRRAAGHRHRSDRITTVHHLVSVEGGADAAEPSLRRLVELVADPPRRTPCPARRCTSMYGSGQTVFQADQNSTFDERPIAGDVDAGAGLAVLDPEIVVARRRAEALDLGEDGLPLLERLAGTRSRCRDVSARPLSGRAARGRRTGNRTTMSGPVGLPDRG